MSEIVESTFSQVWEPEVLDGEPVRPGWLSQIPQSLQSPPLADALIDLRDEVTVVTLPAVEIEEDRIRPTHASWLTAILERAVDRNVSIRKLIEDGRNLKVEDVLRLRALHKGVQLLPEFEWNGPEIKVGEQLVNIAHTQEKLLLDRSRELKELRFRMRLQGIGLEDSLITYAATELIDPRIIDTTSSLDVLCYPDLEMTSSVVLKLGLARAHLDEVEQTRTTHPFRNDRLWSMVRGAWEQDMAYAKAHARRWAQNVIEEGRRPFP